MFEMLALSAGVMAFQTGNSIYPSCLAGQCQGYVIGAVDAYSLDDSSFGIRTICLPDGTNQGQLGEIFTNYLRDHPERRHRPAAELVLEATVKAYPCPKNLKRKR